MKRWLLILLFLVSGVHGYLMIHWMSLWGFFGAIRHWFETFSDPISAAAAFDLMMLMLFCFVWMVRREKSWNRVLSVVTIPFIVFPAFGFLLYLIISDKTFPGENPSKS